RQVPRRRDQGGSRQRADHRADAPGDPARGLAGLRAPRRRRPVQLRDALLQVVGDLRIRDAFALQEARGDGPRPGAARPGGVRPGAAPTGPRPERGRPGRPSTGARERILAACIDVLKEEGYAGLTVAKVAARAGENKALVAYHFGSKQGLVAAA